MVSRSLAPPARSSSAHPTEVPARRRRRLSRVLALGVGALLGLGLGELATRVLGMGTTTITRGALHQYDPDVGWTCTPDLDAHYLKPGSFDVRVRCNSRGLRDTEEHPYAKPAGERRIVFVGDSTMWGWGLEDDQTLAACVERGLPGTQCLNLGANGYSTVQSLVRLETEGLRYAPDVVVQSFVHNDLDSNFDDKDGGRPAIVLDANGDVTVVNRPVRRHWKPAYKQWLRHHSRLFGLLEYTAERWKDYWSSRKAVRERMAEEAPDPRHEVEERRAEGEMVVSDLDLFGAPGETAELAWAAQRAILRRMKELCDGAGAKLVVVHVTARGELDRDALQHRVARYGLAIDDPELGLDENRPRRRIGAICDELGITIVDPTERFREVPDRDSLYLPNDGHWSARGAALAAEELVELLRGP